MITLTNEQVFNGNLGLSANMNQERVIIVSIGTGTAALEVETPAGWLSVKTFDANVIEGFSFKTELNFRFALTGDSVAYLV